MTSISPDISPKIQNVKIKPLKRVENARGNLLEVQRNDEDIYPGFGQVYITTTLPGVIKAWYRHQKQTDQLIHLQGLMKLVLYDSRRDSISVNMIDELIIGKDNPTLVQIPPGVWHGFQSINADNLMIMHLNNHPCHHDFPDEERLDFDDKVIPYTW